MGARVTNHKPVCMTGRKKQLWTRWRRRAAHNVGTVRQQQHEDKAHRMARASRWALKVTELLVMRSLRPGHHPFRQLTRCPA